MLTGRLVSIEDQTGAIEGRGVKEEVKAERSSKPIFEKGEKAKEILPMLGGNDAARRLKKN